MDVVEIIFYLNILLFTTFTWYCFGECRNKKAAAYTSVTITFIILLLIILYHIFTYASAFSKIRKTKAVKILKRIFIPAANDSNKELNLMDIIDCPINTNEYKVPVKQVEPTCSVVEVHQPKLPVPDTYTESTSTQNVHFATDSKITIDEDKV